MRTIKEDNEEIQERYKNYILGRPHVVILGAGATMAAIPNGDKFGRTCSVMDGFIDKLGLRDLLNRVQINTESQNLEDIYSELYSRPDCKEVVSELENRIVKQFSEFVIPDEPTVYDFLLLSLRKKDYIFSFNWDDLLIQAYQRAAKITNDLPHLGFLHGNISVGKCKECGAVEVLRNSICNECGGLLMRPKILFPVKNKDYTDDSYIKNCWTGFLDVISEATLVTIFGYSAPKSDVGAIQAMLRAFSSKFRRLDQIEVIDLKSESELRDTWADFAAPTNYHFNVCRSFFESLLSEFPRRSVEGYWKRDISGWWGKSKVQLKPDMNFEDLSLTLEPLIYDENQNKFDVL